MVDDDMGHNKPTAQSPTDPQDSSADPEAELARLTTLLSKEAVQRPLFRRVRLGLFFFIPVAVVIAGIVNYHYLRVRQYLQVVVPGRAAEAPGLNIVFAADFHLGSLTASHFL